jgi:two-component system, NarL family, nitrate/nitrite sensor histidine kinase NarX
MQAPYHQHRSIRRAHLVTSVIVLAVVAIASGAFEVWLGDSHYAPWSVPEAIQYAALLALLVTAVLLRWAESTPGSNSKSLQSNGADTPSPITNEQASHAEAPPHGSEPRGDSPAHADQSLALLQTVLAGFVDNPESPESFLLLLREIERLIGAKCSAIFISKDIGRRGLPLVCTDPGERACFVDLLRERMPASGLHDLEMIRTFTDPPHPGMQIIAVQLAASDGLRKGLLLVKRRSTLPLSSAETALLSGLGKHLAAIICSAQRAQLNRRIALCEERAVIARELHDSLAQSLSYLKIQTGRLQKLLHVDQREQALDYADADAVLQELRTNLNLAYRQLRELITTFRLTMDGRTLGQALTDSVEEFENRSSVALTLDNRIPDGLLSVDEEMHVLQIVRECVSNVVRHAQAKRAEVSLNLDDASTVQITVDDDGVGMGAPRSPDQHHGLVIMQQRAHSLGGDMRVLGSPDGGTRVKIRFPPRSAHPYAEQTNPLTHDMSL